MNNEKIIVYQTYTDPIQANIVKGLLDSYGIECFLTDENMATLNAMYSQAIGGVKLNIFEKDAERVFAILKSENSDPETELNIQKETNTIICPNCKSNNLSVN